MLNVIMLHVTNRPFMLSVRMLNVIMLIVVMLIVVMLIVLAPILPLAPGESTNGEKRPWEVFS
jgi:hypothetical protein